MTSFTVHILLLILASSGIMETIYLIGKRLHAEVPACPIGDKFKCQIVLESKYNSIFVVHNDILGLLFYMAVVIINLYFLITPNPLPLANPALGILLAGGATMSVFLVVLQWKVIHAWCFWCLASAFTTWAMGVVFLLTKA